MKTVNDIKKEIADLRFRGTQLTNMENDDERKERKRIKARIKYLTPFIAYLESTPSKDFMEAELDKSISKLTAINSRFNPSENLSGSAIGEARKSFDVEWNVKSVKTHIANLKFLLKK